MLYQVNKDVAEDNYKLKGLGLMVNERQMLVDYFYRVMWCEFSDIDASYEDYIIHMIGTAGLNMLRDNRRIEGCGVVNGRQLYSLVKTPVWECRGADADGEK